MAAEPDDVLILAADALEALGIPYMVGGSFASGVHGIRRFTADADLVVDLRVDQIESLARALERDYYVSRDAIREAIRDRNSFNAVHLDTMFKVDFFVLGQDPFDREEFRRRVSPPAAGHGLAKLVYKTAEDTVLRKLQWFRAGGEVSENQWRDVLGVLKVREHRLDEAYMDRWATQLGVSDLLERARREAAG